MYPKQGVVNSKNSGAPHLEVPSVGCFQNSANSHPMPDVLPEGVLHDFPFWRGMPLKLGYHSKGPAKLGNIFSIASNVVFPLVGSIILGPDIYFMFTPIWGRFPILTIHNILQRGWNHQLVIVFPELSSQCAYYIDDGNQSIPFSVIRQGLVKYWIWMLIQFHCSSISSPWYVCII